MNSLYTFVAVLAAIAMIGSIGATSLQQASAIVDIGWKQEFKKLTTEFEKDVLDAAASNPNEIPGLLEQYSRAVIAIIQPSPSP